MTTCPELHHANVRGQLSMELSGSRASKLDSTVMTSALELDGADKITFSADLKMAGRQGRHVALDVETSFPVAGACLRIAQPAEEPWSGATVTTPGRTLTYNKQCLKKASILYGILGFWWRNSPCSTWTPANARTLQPLNRYLAPANATIELRRHSFIMKPSTCKGTKHVFCLDAGFV